MNQRDDEYGKPSKSQKKREMSQLLSTVKELELLSLKELEASTDQVLMQKISELQNIKKGSAKKRQRQHIVKFLSKQGKSFASEDFATLKTSRVTKDQKFREIETLRENLLIHKEKVLDSIKEIYPEIDLKKIKILIDLAQQEDKDGNRTHYRELFKVLRRAHESVI